MPNVNVFELEACLGSLVSLCERHPRKPIVAQYGKAISAAQARLVEAMRETDQVYTRWRVEGGEDKLAYKQLQRATRAAQRQLEALGVVGYPSEEVGYWDEAEAVAAAQAMVAFLEEHRKALDFAEAAASELKKLLGGSARESGETKEALDHYRRISMDRKAAMEAAAEVIGAVRVELRREVGVEGELYRAIRWPAMVAPDPLR